MVHDPLHQAFDRLPALVWVTDEAGRITLTAGAGWRELGLDPSALPKQGVESLARAEAGDFELEVAGRVFEAAVRSVPGDGDAGRGAIGVALDVTERHRREAQRRTSQSIEVVGRVLGGIAHDFNNIITLVDGYASLAIDELAPSHPVTADLLVIREAAERAARLVAQLHALSTRKAGEQGEIHLETIPTRVEGVLRRVLGEAVELEIRAAEGLRPVRADAAELEQVVVDLAVAARDAMPSGGRLLIEVFEEQLDVDGSRKAVPAGSYVGLRVASEGPAHEGSKGFGLAIVRGVVAPHGGHVFVRSEPGRSTVVEVLFPALGADASRIHEPIVHEVEAPERSVLLIEDDPLLREAMLRTLARVGYRVCLAEGPASAIGICEAMDRLDLVIGDTLGPADAEADLVTRVRQLHPTAQIMHVSSRAVGAPARDGDECHVLAKPFTADSLLEKVRSVLESRPRSADQP
jgi:two-component system, cell cycle sensor histidine kinase and response regulator CckA